MKYPNDGMTAHIKIRPQECDTSEDVTSSAVCSLERTGKGKAALLGAKEEAGDFGVFLYPSTAHRPNLNR